MKFGIDFRRLRPLFAPFQYGQAPIFFTVSQAETGHPPIVLLQGGAKATFLLRNLSAFAQDSWHIAPRLTLTYGLRWDVDFSPSTLSGPNFPAVTGFNLLDLSQLALAPTGTPPFSTPYGNLPPPLAATYQLSQDKKWGTVVRGGFGVFYDLATQQIGTLVGQGA